jgi:hypothetical protein
MRLERSSTGLTVRCPAGGSRPASRRATSGDRPTLARGVSRGKVITRAALPTPRSSRTFLCRRYDSAGHAGAFPWLAAFGGGRAWALTNPRGSLRPNTKPCPPGHQAVIASLKAKIETLQTEIARLEATDLRKPPSLHVKSGATKQSCFKSDRSAYSRRGAEVRDPHGLDRCRLRGPLAFGAGE